MDIFLSGKDSLRLTRLARTTGDLVLQPAGLAHRTAHTGPISPAELRAALPQEIASFDAATPIELTYFSRGTRSESREVWARTLLTDLPANAFLEVERASGLPWGWGGTETYRIYVESAGLSTLRMSQFLLRQMADNAIEAGAAPAQLISFVMELCGSYARDPLSRAGDECAYGLEPLASTREVLDFVASLRDVRGIRLARQAATLAVGGSGSPVETMIALLFKLPPELGGVGLPDFVMNEPIEWPDAVIDLLDHDRMRPDIYWPRHRVAFEYEGHTHAGTDAYEEDRSRVRDYQLCGITVIPATKKNVRNLRATGDLIALVAHALAATDGPGLERRVRDLLVDTEASHARAALMEQLRGPLTDMHS